MGDAITDAFNEELPGLLDDPNFGSSVQDMLNSSRLDDNGKVVFSNESLSNFQVVAMENLGTPMAKSTLDSMAGLASGNYRGGQLDGVAPTNGKVGASFNLKDDRALKQLNGQNMFWVKSGGVRTVYDDISKTVKEGLEQGLGRAAIAKTLRESMPGMAARVGRARFDVIASTAVVRARSFGNITEMARIGIETMIWETEGDGRVCTICRPLDQQVISVKELSRTVERVTTATTPEEVIDASPWISRNAAGDWYLNQSDGSKTPASGPEDALAKSGGSPPAHGRCRCDLIANFSEVEEVSERQVELGRAVEQERNAPAANPPSGTIGSVFSERGQQAPQFASNLSMDSVMNTIGLSEQAAQAVTVGTPSLSVSGGAVLAAASWVSKKTGLTVARSIATFSEDAVAMSLEASKIIPVVAVARNADAVAALAAERGVGAIVKLVPRRMTLGMLTAFEEWSLSGEEAAAFTEYFNGLSQAPTMERLGLKATDKIGQWLNVTVDGVSPMVDFLNARGSATFVRGL